MIPRAAKLDALQIKTQFDVDQTCSVAPRSHGKLRCQLEKQEVEGLGLHKPLGRGRRKSDLQPSIAIISIFKAISVLIIL